MLFRVCNSLLGLKFNMLGTEGGSAAAQDFQNTVLPILMDIITVLLGIIAASAALWAIWCAIKMWRADNQEKREAAKQKVIHTVAAVVIVVLLVIIMIFVKNNIHDWLGGGFQEQ